MRGVTPCTAPLTHSSRCPRTPFPCPPPLPADSASLWLNAASTSLLQHLRSPQVAQVVGMLAAIDGADDTVDAISELLQVRGAQRCPACG